MKKSVVLLFICMPVFLFAQRGTIIPDVKPSVPSSVPNTNKVWVIEDYLLDCPDGKSKCYLIKESGVNKTIPVDDVFDFVFEPGIKYTVWVKEEMKTPPVSVNVGIYNYIVVKIVSKKGVVSDASEIPSVTAVTPVSTPTPTASATEVVMINTYESEYKARVEEELRTLKKQVAELKKQLEVLQLQMQLQLQAINPK